MANILAVESKFFDEHREEFANQYPGKYLLIKDSEVAGDFSTVEEAVKRGVQLFGSGPFLVRSPNENEVHLSAPALTVGVPLVANSQL